jgi:hypothetical protein
VVQGVSIVYVLAMDSVVIVCSTAGGEEEGTCNDEDDEDNDDEEDEEDDEDEDEDEEDDEEDGSNMACYKVGAGGTGGRAGVCFRGISFTTDGTGTIAGAGAAAGTNVGGCKRGADAFSTGDILAAVAIAVVVVDAGKEEGGVHKGCCCTMVPV